MAKYCSVIVCLLISIAAHTQNLKKDIQNIISGKNATVAVSVKGLNFPFEFHNAGAGKKLPMQSVFKFHIAAAVLKLVDEGKFTLDQNVWIKKSDLLENTHSPLRDDYPKGELYLPLRKIIDYTVAKSDNNGCDILLRLIGGTETVQKFMNAKGVRDFQISFNEEEMHKNWQAQYHNYTTTTSTVKVLQLFNSGKLLSAASTKFLMDTMLGTVTGRNKLVEQLPTGTPVAHKTGASGKNASGLTGAENDMGIITLPDGRSYAIAVYVSDSMESDSINCKLISDISRTVWDAVKHQKKSKL